MIFKDLRIVDKQLVCNIDLTGLKYYKDCKILSISIDTLDTFNEDFGGAYVYEVPEDKQTDTFSTIFSPANFKKGGDKLQYLTKFGDIVYVKVEFKGTETSNAPCGVKPEVYGIAVNWRKIYNQAMSYVKSVERDCADRSGFIDFSMRLKALELAVKFGDCTFANEMFKHFFNAGKFVSNCNCSK